MIFQKLPDSYDDAPKISLSNHLAALDDETGETIRLNQEKTERAAFSPQCGPKKLLQFWGDNGYEVFATTDSFFQLISFAGRIAVFFL